MPESWHAVRTGFGNDHKRMKPPVPASEPLNKAQNWKNSWGGMGNPYYGNEVQGSQNANINDEQTTCNNVVESQERIISLLEHRLEAEKIEKERLLQTLNIASRNPTRERAQVPKSVDSRDVGGGFGAEVRSVSTNSVSQVANMYANAPTSSNAVFGGGAWPTPVQYEICPGQQGDVELYTSRGNSWFQSGDCHLGGQAPSGRNTPGYWDGNWDGAQWTVQEPIYKRDAPRSALAKHARSEKKKKDRQNIISAKATGATWGPNAPSSDTAEKKKLRDDAWELINILRSRKLQYGQGPEKAFSTGATECARLGTLFLELSSAGEHYASEKHLRAEMMKNAKPITIRISKGIWQNTPK